MYFKNICLLLSLGNVCVRSFSPYNFVSKLDQLKNLKWEKTANIILNKSGKKYKNDNLDDFFSENTQFNGTSLIRLTPGGLRGFYNLGTCVYIKENFDTSNYIYSGASAGAWNGLMMTYKHNPHEFAMKILDSMNENNKLKSVYDTQLYLKTQLLNKYKEEDFDLDRLMIGVTCIKETEIFTNIYTEFEDLEDAIDCCIASSSIPFITSMCESNYRDEISLDGGFSYDPYLSKETVLEIGPDMWNDDRYLQQKSKRNDLYKMFFYNNNNVNFYELYIKGYNEADANKEFLYYTLD